MALTVVAAVARLYPQRSHQASSVKLSLSQGESLVQGCVRETDAGNLAETMALMNYLESVWATV